MLMTWFYAALMLLILAALHMHALRCRRRFAQAKGSDEQFFLRRAVKARSVHVEHALVYVIISAMLEYQGFFGIGIHLFGLTFLACRAMHIYSLLVAEHYINGKLAAKPIWRIRGIKFSRHLLVGFALLLLLKSFMNIFHA